MMASYSDIQYRIRSELSEISEITFSEEELFAYACEACRILHGMIATINPSFLLTGRKSYSKLVDYMEYEDMRWYADFLIAARLSEENSTIPDYVLPAEYLYLDLNGDGVVNTEDFNRIINLDVFVGESNTLHEWLKTNNKLDPIDYSTLILPEDCMFIHNMYISTSGGNFKMVATNLDVVMYYQATNGTPAYFSRTGNQLMLAPATTEPKNIRLFYVPAFSDPEDDISDFGIPDTFIPFVVEYVVLRAHNRNDRKTLVEQSFLNQKGELIQTILGKEEIHMQTIPTLTNYPYINVR